jgi:hypothetical protein
MPTKNSKKGIYCLEGLWDHHNIQDQSTVLPILDLLQKRDYCNYIYHDCATKEELEFFLDKWKRLSVSNKYPILYFAFHGEEGSIFFTNKKKYTLDELGDYLEGKCFGKVIYFGSCSTLKIDKRIIKSFLEKTGAIAAIGYKIKVDWMLATAFELLVLSALQEDKFDTQGIHKVRDKIMQEYGKLDKILNFRMVINNRMHFKRSQSKKKIV